MAPIWYSGCRSITGTWPVLVSHGCAAELYVVEPPKIRESLLPYQILEQIEVKLELVSA